MSEFENIFGVKKQKINKYCIIAPYLTKQMIHCFGAKKFSSGKIYKTATCKNFTLIKTGIGAPFVGDAVLYLLDTPCKFLIFFGSCGAIDNKNCLEIGDVVVPQSSVAIESFTTILHKSFDTQFKMMTNGQLLNKILKESSRGHTIKRVNLASFGSFKLESTNVSFLKKNHIDVVDLECASFMHAAKRIKKKALAVLFVTDIVEKNPFYAEKSSLQINKINNATKSSIQLIQKIISLP